MFIDIKSRTVHNFVDIALSRGALPSRRTGSSLTSTTSSIFSDAIECLLASHLNRSFHSMHHINTSLQKITLSPLPDTQMPAPGPSTRHAFAAPISPLCAE